VRNEVRQARPSCSSGRPTYLETWFYLLLLLLPSSACAALRNCPPPRITVPKDPSWIQPIIFLLDFESPTAGTVLWDATPCADCSSCCSVFSGVFDPEDGGSMLIRNICSCQSTRRHVPESSIALEEYYLLEYNAVKSVIDEQTFRRNISSPSSGSKNKRRKKRA
jgi:hypothetical protein